MFTQHVKGKGTKFDFGGVVIPNSFTANETEFGSGSNFAEIKLTGSTAGGHTISCKKAVFEPGCHFVGADFGTADFKEADFKENSLSGAIMDQVKNLATAKGIQTAKDVEMMKFIHEMVRRALHALCNARMRVCTAASANHTQPNCPPCTLSPQYHFAPAMLRPIY